jgi:hypothetical protein
LTLEDGATGLISILSSCRSRSSLVGVVVIARKLTYGNSVAIFSDCQNQKYEAISGGFMADEPVNGEPVSPCYSLFSPVMFEKAGHFPVSSNDLRSIFFQGLSTFPSVMVFSLCYDRTHARDGHQPLTDFIAAAPANRAAGSWKALQAVPVSARRAVGRPDRANDFRREI